MVGLANINRNYSHCDCNSSINQAKEEKIRCINSPFFLYFFLFKQLKDVVPEKLGKNKVDDIIKEEMGHIRVLSKELLALAK